VRMKEINIKNWKFYPPFLAKWSPQNLHVSGDMSLLPLSPLWNPYAFL
jgi:hypothetical protein